MQRQYHVPRRLSRVGLGRSRTLIGPARYAKAFADPAWRTRDVAFGPSVDLSLASGSDTACHFEPGFGLRVSGRRLQRVGRRPHRARSAKSSSPGASGRAASDGAQSRGAQTRLRGAALARSVERDGLLDLIVRTSVALRRATGDAATRVASSRATTARSESGSATGAPDAAGDRAERSRVHAFPADRSDRLADAHRRHNSRKVASVRLRERPEASSATSRMSQLASRTGDDVSHSGDLPAISPRRGPRYTHAPTTCPPKTAGRTRSVTPAEVAPEERPSSPPACGLFLCERHEERREISRNR